MSGSPSFTTREAARSGLSFHKPEGKSMKQFSIAMAAIPALRPFCEAMGRAYYVLVCLSCINARTSAINNAADHRTVINRAVSRVWSECAARSSETSRPSARMIQIYRRSLQEDVNHSATCCLSGPNPFERSRMSLRRP